MDKFKGKFLKALEIIKLNKATVAAVYAEKGALKMSALLFFVPFVVNLLLSTVLFPSGFRALFSRYSLWPLLIPYLSVILMIGAVYLLLDKYFKKSPDLEGVMNVTFHAGVFWWLTMVPYVFAALGLFDLSAFNSLIWYAGFALVLWALYTVLRDVLKLKDNEVIISLVFAVIAFVFAQNILGNLLIGSYYHLF
jgi:hypothetical protein